MRIRRSPQTPGRLPGPGLAGRATRGSDLAYLLDPELIADEIGGIALHLPQPLLQDAGTGAQTGLATEGAHRGPRRILVQGWLLTQLVKLVDGIRATGLGRALRGLHTGLLELALAGTACLTRFAPQAGSQLPLPLSGFLRLTLGIRLLTLVTLSLIIAPFILALAGLGLILAFTLTRFLGLRLLGTARGGLILGLLPALF